MSGIAVSNMAAEESQLTISRDGGTIHQGQFHQWTLLVNEKKGRKGEKRKEKRQTELGILQLFEKEVQEWIKAKKEGREKVVGGREKKVKKTES
ncbi:hypothetical protein INR49_000624 [Caranx melampygus]|nr:hypothetical protein INR49_000624 [Caranx melampygus]